MTSFTPDKNNAQNLKKQTDERLMAAKALYEMRLYNDSINRAYYGVFSAATLLF
jgi:uncharacterized protein (UPF0332 family)